MIENYFKRVKLLIQSSQIVASYEIEEDKRGLYEGLIKGKINLKDKSLLHFREFVYVEIAIDRKMYSYQYMD